MVLASVNTKCTPAFKSVNPWERNPPPCKETSWRFVAGKTADGSWQCGIHSDYAYARSTPAEFPAALRVFPAIRAKSNLMLDDEALISRPWLF